MNHQVPRNSGWLLERMAASGLGLVYIIDDSSELSIGGARDVCLPQELKYDG